MEEKYIQIVVSAPEEKIASDIAEKLLVARLVACVQVSSQVISYYRWKGKIEKAVEVLLYIKTSERRYNDVEKMVLELHPYDVPEIIALPILQGNKNYLSWVEENVKG